MGKEGGEGKRGRTSETIKIKHLQKCFGVVVFPRLHDGCKSVVKMFYFTCNHIYLQHVFSILKHLQKCFANVLQHFCKCFSVKRFAKHSQNILEAVT